MFKLGAELVGAGCMIVAMASTPWRMETLLVLVLSCASLAAARESHLTTKGKKKQISLTYRELRMVSPFFHEQCQIWNNIFCRPYDCLVIILINASVVKYL